MFPPWSTHPPTIPHLFISLYHMIFIPTFFQAYHTYPSLSYPSPRISMSALFHTPHHLFSHYISTPSPFNTSTHVLTSPPFLSLWHHHIPVFFFRCSLPYPSSPSSCPPDPPRSSALYPPFRHIRRLVSEIKIMFLLVFVEYLEEWSKICISTGSSMRLFKFAVITSQRKKSRRWRLRSMRRCWK